MAASAITRFDNIPYDELSPESSWIRLGKGSFGCVWKGEYLGLDVAIKEVMPSGEYDVDKYFQRECRLMAESRHPNIVQYLGLSLAPAPPAQSSANSKAHAATRQRILIISEFLPRGNLRQYIDDTSLAFPWRVRLSFAIDIARALAYLHSRHVIHRDLKGENLLVTENERVKMCDFGLARVEAKNEDEMRRISYCGTDGYMSPEILLGEEFGVPTDIFSFGVILCEILSRRLADHRTFARQMPSFTVSQSEVRSLASPHCPPSFLSLALSCVSAAPSDRPVITDILSQLRVIEREVLEAETRGLPLDDDGEAIIAGLEVGRGSWNVGSISFAGTVKRGTVTNGGKKKRPQAGPRLPSFEGRVTVGSSMLDHRRQHQREGVNESEDSEDDDDEVALLRVADIVIDGNSHATRTRHAEEAALNDVTNRKEDEDGHRYSTSVMSRRLKGRKPIADDDADNERDSFVSSTSTLTVRADFPEDVEADDDDAEHKHERLASNASSLPPIPASWLAAPHPRRDQDDDGSSYLTARTDTPSIAAATIAHGAEDEADDQVQNAHKRVNEGEDESRDVFHSTLLASQDQVDAAIAEAPLALHRFSLIKPSLQRFLRLGSGSGSAALDSSSELGKRASGAMAGAPSTGKCGSCRKRVGGGIGLLTRPYLECDDCGFQTHIKCSDACPPGCPATNAATEDKGALLAPPKPTRAPPVVPAA